MPAERSADIRRYLLRRCSAKGIPVSGIFEITPRCNLKCKMCYVRLTEKQMEPLGKELSAQQWINLAKECKDAGLVFLLITGGEPTLRKDFTEIYKAVAEMGISIAVNTNATMLTPEIREMWSKNPPSQVNITLYGVCREDYNNLCGNPDAYDKVIDALDWLMREGILVHLNTTITPSNFSKWVEIEAFAKSRNLELRVNSYCFPPTRRSACSDCSDFSRLSAEKAGELTALDILYREGLDAIKTRADNLGTPLQNSCDLDIGDSIQCMAGSSQFWLAWNGDITPCGMLYTPAISVLDKGFLPAWDELKDACSKIRLCPDCVNCPEKDSCMKCAAVTFSETGRFDGKPEYMCRLNKSYRETVLKIVNDAENCG